MIPWGFLTTNPELVVLIPFVWFLWQFYAPPLIDTVVGYESEGQEHLYETRVTRKLRGVFSQIERVDDNVERVAETQEDLVNITLAQTRHMNGYDGDIDLQEVKRTLTEERKKTPDDFLRDNGDGRYEDSEDTDDTEDT